MSFSKEVKQEASELENNRRHCMLAELAALISLNGTLFLGDNQQIGLRIQTENLFVAKKCFTLLKKAFNINTLVSVRNYAYHRSNYIYTVGTTRTKDTKEILMALKFSTAETKELQWEKENMQLNEEAVNGILIQKDCCRRAFLRGAFLAAGSISDPEKSYHLEIVSPTMKKAQQLSDICATFGIDAHIVSRQKSQTRMVFVTYVKEGDQIADFINICGAYITLMNFENIRIKKEIANQVNRSVNCEAANIKKTVSAAVRQVKDIEIIQSTIGLEALPENLEELARLRLQYPQATLTELSSMLHDSVGKSGVNHRLRKIKEIADELRQGKENPND